MTNPKHDSTKTSRWRHCDIPDEIYYGPLLRPSASRCTLITKRPTKILNPTNASLFGLIPLDILAAIYIWIAVIEYHNKFKHVLSRLESTSIPVLHKILTKYWTPYHNF